MKSLRSSEVDTICDKLEKDVFFISTWKGVVAAKNPCDAWIYQEIIWEQKPDLILETGSFRGGGGLFLASLLDMVGAGEVISVDTINYDKPAHPRITWITANSTQADFISYVVKKARGKRCMVILDSDHNHEHVYEELLAFHDLVAPNLYLIVEDTWWHPGSDGPYVAVQKFLAKDPPFKIDNSKERYLLTNNPSGYLLRV